MNKKTSKTKKWFEFEECDIQPEFMPIVPHWGCWIIFVVVLVTLLFVAFSLAGVSMGL